MLRDEYLPGRGKSALSDGCDIFLFFFFWHHHLDTEPSLLGGGGGGTEGKKSNQ